MNSLLLATFIFLLAAIHRDPVPKGKILASQSCLLPISYNTFFDNPSDVWMLLAKYTWAGGYHILCTTSCTLMEASLGLMAVFYVFMFQYPPGLTNFLNPFTPKSAIWHSHVTCINSQECHMALFYHGYINQSEYKKNNLNQLALYFNQ
jgi:hypothetical protein